MKNIHPAQKVCKVKCACGNEFEVKSTKDESVIHSTQVSLKLLKQEMYKNSKINMESQINVVLIF